MKLYFKQKAFSFKGKGTILDENGDDRYYFEGKVFSLGKKITITDLSGNEVAFIRQKVPSIRPRYFVEIGGEQVAAVVGKFKILKHEFTVEGPEWDVRGNFSGHDYSVVEGETAVASIHKQWFTWGDAFEIDIADPKNEIIVLGIVMAIDAVLDAESASAASAASSSTN